VDDLRDRPDRPSGEALVILATFAAAVLVSSVVPRGGFVLISTALVLQVRPEVTRSR
jgi:hypothetical protein